MVDEDFLFTTTEVERGAWIAFKSIVTKFVDNNTVPECVIIVANELEKLKVLW
jgi:hypothetical protein